MRSSWKRFFYDPNILLSLDRFKIKRSKADVTKDSKYYFWSRNSHIPECLVGDRIAVYNGKKFISFTVRIGMPLFKFGSFALTKKLGFSVHEARFGASLAKKRNKINVKKKKK